MSVATSAYDAARGSVLCFVRIAEKSSNELKHLRHENEELRRDIEELRALVNGARK